MFEKTSTAEAPARPGAVLQRRGVERVQAILNAAEELLAEQGYQAATLKAVGERAGIPTASVYHYFADRHQVETKLMQRHLSALGERVDAAFDDPSLHTVRDGVDATIDPMLDYFREFPSCAELWFAGRHEELAELVQTFDRAKAERLWHLFIDRNLLAADTPLRVLQLAFEAGSRLFDIAFQASPTGDESTMDEARRLVTAYLETYAP
ncbi:TetR/AcrR family transcriptional regulator [Haloechinothrix halophila]|uniref:TetR/AcrR family transcriptional regulator n=1 Tax=Haloechinothrix halophila TaxID=1069073 RepID=UPI000401252B|nr:TetR/AcrR family transcriptional regulator [Haloechinothrix halophila]